MKWCSVLQLAYTPAIRSQLEAGLRDGNCSLSPKSRHMEGRNRPGTRSRLGCLTCRQRKKKCDETLYPVCQNCDKKGLGCVWPAEKHELNKLMQQVKYVATSKEPGLVIGTSQHGISKRKKLVEVTSPPSTKKSHILERIALQQDIQETDKEDVDTVDPNIRGKEDINSAPRHFVSPIVPIEPEETVDLGQFFNSENIFEFIDEQFMG